MHCLLLHVSQDDMTSSLVSRLKALKKDIQEVNWARKNQQTLVGDHLRQLESQWVGLVSKNYEIEQVFSSFMSIPSLQTFKLTKFI